jgi:hypothetical protein
MAMGIVQVVEKVISMYMVLGPTHNNIKKL